MMLDNRFIRSMFDDAGRLSRPSLAGQPVAAKVCLRPHVARAAQPGQIDWSSFWASSSQVGAPPTTFERPSKLVVMISGDLGG